MCGVDMPEVNSEVVVFGCLNEEGNSISLHEVTLHAGILHDLSEENLAIIESKSLSSNCETF